MTFRKNKNCILKFTNLRKNFLEFLIKNFFEENRKDFEKNFNIIDVENDFKNFLKFLKLNEDLNSNLYLNSNFLRDLEIINCYFYNNYILDKTNIFLLLKDLKVFDKTEVQEFLKNYLSNYLENFNKKNENEEEEKEFINTDVLTHLEILLDYHDQKLMTEFLDVFPSNKEKINALKSSIKYLLINYSKIYFNNETTNYITNFIKNNLDKDFDFKKEIENNDDYKYFDIFLKIFYDKNYLLEQIDRYYFSSFIVILTKTLIYLKSYKDKNYNKDKFYDFLEAIKFMIF